MIKTNLFSLLLGIHLILLNHLRPLHNHFHRTLHLFYHLLNEFHNLSHHEGLIIIRVNRLRGHINRVTTRTSGLQLRLNIIQRLHLMFQRTRNVHLQDQHNSSHSTTNTRRDQDGRRSGSKPRLSHRFPERMFPSQGPPVSALCPTGFGCTRRLIRRSTNLHLRMLPRQSTKHSSQRRSNSRRGNQYGRPCHLLISRERPLRTLQRPVHSRRLRRNTRHSTNRRQAGRQHRRTFRRRQRTSNPIQNSRRSRSLNLILAQNNARTGHHTNRRSNRRSRRTNRHRNSHHHAIRRQRSQIRSLTLVLRFLSANTTTRRFKCRLMFNQILRFRARQPLRINNNRRTSLMFTIQVLLRRNILMRILATRVYSFKSSITNFLISRILRVSSLLVKEHLTQQTKHHLTNAIQTRPCSRFSLIMPFTLHNNSLYLRRTKCTSRRRKSRYSRRSKSGR